MECWIDWNHVSRSFHVLNREERKTMQPCKNELLFAIVTSDTLNMHNTKRGFRFVIFDSLGNTITRPDLENSAKTSAQATKWMREALNSLDAHAITVEGIANFYKIIKNSNTKHSQHQPNEESDLGYTLIS